MGLLRGVRGVLRVCLLCTLVAITAGPMGLAPHTARTLIFVFDQSRSMPAGVTGYKSRLMSEANRQRHAVDRIGVVVFGASPLVEQYPDDRPPDTTLGTSLNPDRSNLHAALAAALQLIPEKSPARILVVSDGETDDDPSPELLAELRRRHVPVDFQQFPLDEQRAGNDPALESVTATPEVPLGGKLQLEYRIRCELPTAATLHIRRDTEAVAALPLQLEAGTIAGSWSEPCEQVGAFHYSVNLQVASDVVPGNNVWDFWVRVAGAPTVLVVNASGTESPMAEILRAAGLSVELVSAAKADGSLEKLSGYAACVLENVSLADLTSFSQKALIAYVERLGGGLIVTGGTRSYGIGGYRSSQLDPMLPVALRPLSVRERDPVALVILVDPAAWDSQNLTTQENSPLQQALLSLTSELDASDRVGLVATSAAQTVVLPLTVPSKSVRESISQLGFSSDPATFPRALGDAWEMLRTASQPSKHLLVLIDSAQFHSWPPPELSPIIKKPIGGASVTVVTWGGLDATITQQWKLLHRGGRINRTTDVQELLGILRQDWEIKTGGSFVERSTPVRWSGDAESGQREADSEPLPEIDGFHTATLRDGGTAIVVATNIPTQPLVARWNRDLGRVCTVMFPVQAPREAHAEDARLATLLSDQVKWAARVTNPTTPLVVSNQPRDGTCTVRLPRNFAAPDGAAAGDPPVLNVIGGDGLPATQTQFEAIDSEWVAQFSMWKSHSYLPVVQSGDRVITRSVPVMLPRSTEFLKQRSRDENRTVLARLAAESGGNEWQPGTPLLEGIDESYRSLVPIFACVALLLLVIDVADRRTNFVGRLDAHWRRRTEQPAAQEPEVPVAPGEDPFELAKERMRRRVRR
jgi:Ca-activated chloride channel family protein